MAGLRKLSLLFFLALSIIEPSDASGYELFKQGRVDYIEEFVASGGVFGVVSDEQKVINTQVIREIFQKHNSIAFEEKKQVQTMNLSLETQNHSVIRNIILDNYYLKDVPFTIGVLKGVSYQEITNLTLICHNRSKCKYGIKYGYGKECYSEGCTLNNITLSGYVYPMMLFSWNTVIGRIDCYRCEYGPILLGTSLSVGTIFCNGCKNGPLFGAVLDEKGKVISDKKDAYLSYSNIDVVSTDGNDVGFCMGVGYAKYITIGTFGMEARKADCLIASFYETSNTYTIGTIAPEYTPEKFYRNYIKKSSPDNVMIAAVFGENITHSFTKSDIVNCYIEKSNPYLSKLDNTATAIHTLVPVAGKGSVRNDVYFGSELVNGSGSSNGNSLRTSNSFGKYLGVISGNQRILVKLRGCLTPASSNDSENRQILFLGKLVVGDADQYNKQHVLGETLINVAIDAYKKGNRYTALLTNHIPGLEVSIDSSGDLPKLVITFPHGNRLLSYNYVYNLECIGGAYTSVEVEKD